MSVILECGFVHYETKAIKTDMRVLRFFTISSKARALGTLGTVPRRLSFFRRTYGNFIWDTGPRETEEWGARRLSKKRKNACSHS
jgi:hypothetical protein